ncbi:MAG: S-layer homology domain-containing protein, partial [Clostridia bacterium]|nr:S-layer homology domain-containing protein [Clostridia bacterium]
MTVSYDPASVTNPDFLGAYRYNPDTKMKWDYLGGKVDKDKKVVTFTTPHLSEYALMEYHKTFNDVAGSFAKADIEYLASRHIIYGVTDTKFDPLGNITRAQFCALVARALNLQASSSAPSFKDVSGSYWAAKEIQAAAQAGIVKGYTDGTFKPDQFINREQLAAMVARALVYSGGGTLPAPEQAKTILNRFQDQNRITSGLAREVALAADRGIVL